MTCTKNLLHSNYLIWALVYGTKLDTIGLEEIKITSLKWNKVKPFEHCPPLSLIVSVIHCSVGLSFKASTQGCNVNFKQVDILTPYSQCISPPPTAHKQSPGCLIGQAVHRWWCTLSSPWATGAVLPWFPRWSAPLAHLGRGTAIQEKHTKQTPNRKTHALTCINTHTRLDKQSVKMYTDTHIQRSTHSE